MIDTKAIQPSHFSMTMSILCRLPVLLALALALSAQETPAPVPPTLENPQPSTDVVTDDQNQATPASTGPGVLSRTFTTTPLEDQQLRFRPFLSVSAIDDNGLTTPTTSSTAKITNMQNYGVDVGFGIFGRRIYKHDTFELDFSGDAFAYRPTSTFDGANYLLAAIYTHQFNRKISLALNENAGLYSNNYTLPSATTDLSLGGTNQPVTPNTQIFDNTTLSLSTGADLVIQETNRLSFDFGGSGFLVHHDSSLLYGTVSEQARSDVNYRLTRHVTIGTYYGFTDYQFSHAFGNTQNNTLGLELSDQLTKSLQLRIRAGGSHVATLGTQTIVLDPITAAILGEASGAIAVRRTNYLPDFTAQLSKSYRVGTASIEFVENVTAGNGIMVTSRHILTSGHYNYSGLRRWSLSLSASRDVLNTLGVMIGSYSSYLGNVRVGRTLARGFQTSLVGEYRHFDLSQVSFLHNAYRVSLGVTWSPGERPVRFN